MLKIRVSKIADDDGLIHGIRKGRKKTLYYLYKYYFPSIKNYILKSSGSEEDAKDVFQQALLSIFLNISNKNFELTRPFKTYVHAVSYNIWKRKQTTVKAEDFNEYQDTSPLTQKEINNAVLTLERYQFYRRKFEELSDSCQQMLKMYLSGLNIDQISEHFGFTDSSETKKKKFTCKKHLITLIENDPVYQKLIGNE